LLKDALDDLYIAVSDARASYYNCDLTEMEIFRLKNRVDRVASEFRKEKLDNDN
jgi:hypothetical protein